MSSILKINSKIIFTLVFKTRINAKFEFQAIKNEAATYKKEGMCFKNFLD